MSNKPVWRVEAHVYAGATIAGDWSAVFKTRREAIAAANRANTLREWARRGAVSRQYDWLVHPPIEGPFGVAGWSAIRRSKPRISVSCPHGAVTLTRIDR